MHGDVADRRVDGAAGRGTAERGLRLVGRIGAAPADGGVERYGLWLERALEARGLLEPRGTPFALKARDGGPLVRTGDGCSAEWVAATGRASWRWRKHVDRERAAILAARRVVATSPMVAAELARHYGRSDVRVVLNPVLSAAADVAPEPRADGAIVFVGHAFRRKGLDWLVEARTQLSGRTLHVIGGDTPTTRTPGVVHHGSLDAAPWIAGAALVVHPARYEPYGNVIAEAVAAGTPVVCSDACGAACLLHPSHVWRRADGVGALGVMMARAVRDPAPPARLPPGGDAHLDALLDALFG